MADESDGTHLIGQVKKASNSPRRIGVIGEGSTSELDHTIEWSGASDVPDHLTDATTTSAKYDIEQ